MSAFTAVATGNQTNATDINQLINAFNGTTAVATMFPTATSNASNCWTVQLPSVPSSDQVSNAIGVTGDTFYRAGFYITGASGNLGGIFVADGSNIKGHMYGVSSGFRITESLTIDTGLTVSGTGTFNGSSNFAGAAAFNSTSTFVGSATFDNNILLSTAFLQNAASVHEFMGFGLNGGPDAGIYEGAGNALSLISNNNIWIKKNNYFDGSNDRFISSGGQAIQVATGIGAYFGLRGSSNTPTAGAVITWGGVNELAQFLGGVHLYSQSTDPGAAAGEGDIWFDG